MVAGWRLQSSTRRPENAVSSIGEDLGRIRSDIAEDPVADVHHDVVLVVVQGTAVPLDGLTNVAAFFVGEEGVDEGKTLRDRDPGRTKDGTVVGEVIGADEAEPVVTGEWGELGGGSRIVHDVNNLRADVGRRRSDIPPVFAPRARCPERRAGYPPTRLNPMNSPAFSSSSASSARRFPEKRLPFNMAFASSRTAA